MESYHVTPTNDIKPHIDNECCHCKPDIIILDNKIYNGKLIIHHAFDCRELQELNPHINN